VPPRGEVLELAPNPNVPIGAVLEVQRNVTIPGENFAARTQTPNRQSTAQYGIPPAGTPIGVETTTLSAGMSARLTAMS